MSIYSYMLKKHGVLPTMIDKEKVADFILAVQGEGEAYMSIDKVGGW